MNTGELIIKILTGSAVGYISSFISLKVLFGKYALISNTNEYTDFKSHLAESLENNILKGSYIKNQIENDSFKKELNEIINDFFYNSLDENIPNITFKDIPEYELLKSNLNNFFINDDFIKNINLNDLLNNLDLSTILNDDSLKYLSNQVYQNLSPVIIPEIKPIVLDLYDQVKDNKINEILSENTLDKLKQNIEPVLNTLKENIKKIEPDIENIINNFWNEVKIDEILVNIENNIKEKTLIDLIGLENKDQLTTELINHFIDFVKSEEGKSFVNKLSSSLLKMIKEVDSPIINFLMPILQVRIFNFLERNIPFLADNAKEWLRINKKEIENIIEETIEEYYSKQDLMGQLKLTVKDIIGLKISEYFQVVEKGIEKFESYIDKDASQDITNKLIEFLGNKKISDIVIQLNIKEDTLADFFHIFINNYLPKVNTKIFDSILNKKIGDIKGLFEGSLTEKFGNQIKSLIIDKIKAFVLSEYLINKIKGIIPEKFDNFKTMNLSEIISKEKIEGYLGFLPMFLMFSKGKIIDFITNQIKNYTEADKLFTLINQDNEVKIKQYLNDLYLSKTKDIINNLDSADIKTLYENNKSFDKENLLEYIKNNSNELIENQAIKNLRVKTLSLSSETLNNIIEKYIGNEYTPILLICALVGSFYGILIYFLELGLLHQESYITPIAFFLIGIFISYISSEMLFKPYEKSFAFKRKNIFSENISLTLENEFKQSNNLFTEKEELSLKSYISSDNYNIFDKLNKTNIKEIISNKSNDYILNLIDSKKYSELISNKVFSFELNKISKEKFDNIFNSIINKSELFLTDFFSKKIYSYKDKDLSSLPEKLKIDIEEQIALKVNDKVKELLKELKEVNPTEKIKDSLDGIENYLNLDIKLNQAYLPEDEIKERVITQLSQIIKDKIPEGINKYIEKNFIEEQLSPNKEISTLFNGELILFARNNITFLIEKILLEFGLEKLKNQKENISRNIIENVRQANKDSFLYGLGESFFSIDTDIENIVYLLIDEKLEPYLHNKKFELNSLLVGFIDTLSKKKLEELGLNNEILNSNNINSLVERFVNHNSISDSINHMSKALIDDILNLKISFILNILGIKSLKDIPEKVDEQINLIKNQFIENIENRDNIDNLLKISTKDLINKGIYTQKLDLLFKDIEINEISNSVEKIVSNLFKTDIINTYKSKLSEGIYKVLENKKGSDFINIESFNNDIENFINDIKNSDYFKNELKDILNTLINNLFNEINIILPNETKAYILDILVKSISESINKNSLDIINSLDTKNIIQKSINNISNPDMEVLFYDITEFSFKNALVYGSIGAIIGILDIVISKYYG